MKIILAGYPGSQRLVHASRYLIEKYLPGFETFFLNYAGPIEGWSMFVSNHLKHLDDVKIIFGLDDYLVQGFDKERYEFALTQKPCVKLCESTETEHREYPVTTQYTIWDRLELIDLLSYTTSPWDFEINGSRLFKGESQVVTCIDYNNHSALSSRWPGINLQGIKEEDLLVVKSLL